MSKQKIVIDLNKCIGAATCTILAPETFSLDPKTGKAIVTQQPVEINDNIQQAIAACPVGAISLVDEQT